MFKDIAQWSRIRRRVLKGGVSQRQIVRETGISRSTVRKMLKFMLPPGYRQQQPIRRPKLGPWIEVINQIVKEDGTRPKKQQNTAQVIWQRLCEEQEFSGGYTIVKDYVRKARLIANADTKIAHQSESERREPPFESEDPAQITYMVLKSLPERE